MELYYVAIILALVFSLFAMYYVGYITGDGLKDKRVCSAWYEENVKNKTKIFINATVFDNLSILPLDT